MELSFLDLSPRPQSLAWTPVKVVFIGAENYALISVDAEVRIEFVPGGFETKFREPFAVPADILLGSAFRRTKIADIEIRMPGFVMSMAKMNPARYPREIVAGQTVRINE